MRSFLTRGFRRHFQALPAEVQVQARRAYAIWRNNPHHGSLQFKQVGRCQPVYSVRVGRGWRALGLRDRDAIYWFWIGSHAEYDELLKRL